MILAYILGAVFIIFCVFAPCLCTRRYKTALAVEDEDVERGVLDVERQQPRTIGPGARERQRRRRQRQRARRALGRRARRALDDDFVPDLTQAAYSPLPIYARHPTQDEVKLAGTPPHLPPPIYQSKLKDTHEPPFDHAG